MPQIRARGGEPTRLGVMVALGVVIAGCAGYFWHGSHREGLERRGVRVTVVDVLRSYTRNDRYRSSGADDHASPAC